MLVMFGPMIFRQFKKYQRNKSEKQTAQPAEGPISRTEDTGRYQ